MKLIEMMKQLFARIKNLFPGSRNLSRAGYYGKGRSFQRRQNRRSAPNTGRRSFKYQGVDGQLHTARIGKPFNPRPQKNPGFVVASAHNRPLLEVK